MPRLKANKTRLYKLTGTFAKLPSIQQTQFTKAHRQRSCWLEWTQAGGLRCKTHLIDLQGLQERGMVENFAAAMDRRREERRAACEHV